MWLGQKSASELKKEKANGLETELLAVALTLDQGFLRKLVNPSYTREKGALNRSPRSLPHEGKTPPSKGTGT